jgi:uncharacterized coiled-coil protein SlyX
MDDLEQRLTELECRYAEQGAVVDELSTVVAEQQRLIDALRAEVVEQRGRLSSLASGDADAETSDTVHNHGALVSDSDLAFNDDAW